MVELVLHHTGQIAADPFVVLRAVELHPFGMNTGGALHLLVDTRQREAAFLEVVLGRFFVVFKDMGIDKDLLEVFVFREILGNQIKVDDDQADILSDLWSGQSDAFAGGQRLPHVIYQLREFGIIESDILAYFSQAGLSIYINR